MRVDILCVFAGLVSTILVSLALLHGKHQIVVRIKPELAAVQAKKAGTPTIGGIAFCIGATIACFLFNGSAIQLFVMWIFALIGLWDDMEKTTTENGDGLSPKVKFTMQTFCAVLSVMALMLNNELDTTMFGTDYQLLYVFFAICFLLFYVNAVNITDGLDGLAGLVSLPPLFLLSCIHGDAFQFAFIGSLLGFLVFNLKPAKYFMGDAGSHAIGAVIAVNALTGKCEGAVLVASLPLIIEFFSSLIQIISIRVWRRKVFTIAPLHHAFEKRGVSETTIVLGFTFLAFCVGVLSFFMWFKG
jgi:phospho-N-acetylmuramoyl-pentapeptide-transferase